MTPTQALALSGRMLLRDWRAGELRLFAIALVIAVGAVTAVGFFNDRLQGGLASRSAEMLGADLVVRGPEPLARAWVEEAMARGLSIAETTDFSSVAVSGERLQLANVRAAGIGFPVRGAMRVGTALHQLERNAVGTPLPGTAWVEARLLHELGVDVGKRIGIGNARFTITRVLTYEPGRSGNFFAFAPRVLINADDVARTGVIQPGSRVIYALGVAGEPAAVTGFQSWLEPQLTTSQRLISPREGGGGVTRALDRVERYIGLTGLLAVLLAGVAIAMAARRYSMRHYDMSAMLRCLGCTQRDVLMLYLPPLALLGVLASLAGCALGYGVQEAIYWLLKDLFPVKLPRPGFAPVGVGLATGLVVLAGFASAPVLRLRLVPPLRVLRRELAPLPPSSWIVVGSAMAALLLLMWRYTGSWTLTLGVLGGVVGALAALGALAWGLLRLGRRAHAHVGAVGRFGFNNLTRRMQASVGQILAFGLTLMSMALIALLRTDLLTTWQTQLPEQTPNHFAFNVLPADVAGFERFLVDNDVRAQALYPMVRGRLVEIDGDAVRRAVSKEDGEDTDSALRRELNLSWAAAMPPDNVLVRGAWWDGPRGEVTRVSVEEKLAQRLDLDLGTRLAFNIGGARLEAEVTSIRRVQWDSFHPNFFMIFEPGALDDHPATWLTSFYLPSERKALIAPMVRAFPAVTVLELDQFLTQVRTMVQQASLAVELVLLFVLAAGFAVLFAALATSLDERFHEGALLRTLGASRRQLRAGHLVEFTALGVLAGVLAAMGTELTAYVVYTRAFDLAYSFKWPVWIIAPLAGGLLIGVAGYIGTRRVVQRSPLVVLREV